MKVIGREEERLLLLREETRSHVFSLFSKPQPGFYSNPLTSPNPHPTKSCDHLGQIWCFLQWNSSLGAALEGWGCWAVGRAPQPTLTPALKARIHQERCVGRDLWRSLVKPPAPSKASSKPRQGFSEHQVWRAHILYVMLSHFLLTGKGC